MRSFIAYSYLVGNFRWVLSNDFAGSTLEQVLGSLPRLYVKTGGTAGTAGFFALGCISDKEEQSPCIAVVPSDKASIDAMQNVVIEAHMQAVPLAIVTIGDLDGSPFENIVPTIHIGHESQITPEVFTSWNLQGPRHIHLAQAYVDTVADMIGKDHDFEPEFPEIKYPRPNLAELARTLRFHPYDGLVVMAGWLNHEDRDAALWLARELNAPVVADATSGIREELGNLCLRDADKVLSENPPGTILRLGHAPSSPFWKKLEELPGTKVFSITRDSDSGLDRDSQLIRGELGAIIEALGEIVPIGDPIGLIKGSRKRQGKVEELLLSHTESAPALLKAVSEFACIADNIYLSPGKLLHIWNDVAQRRIPTPCVTSQLTAKSNLPVGRIATFLGNSSASDESWAVLDGIPNERELEELALADGKIIIVSIDMFLDEKTAPSLDLRECAEKYGYTYKRISSSFDLEQLESPADLGVTIVEIIPDPNQTKAFYNSMQYI